MIVCHERRFIFIAVNKTCSSSMHTAFRQLGMPSDRLAADGPTDDALHHISAARLRELTGDHVWQTYFKFAFVRNPWDRLVSYYHYLRHSPWVKSDTTGARESGTFRKWIARGCYTKQTQISLICRADGRPDVDFLGRYERLHADFKEVCARIGVEYSLPWINAHRLGHYVEHYDDRSLAATDEILRPDANHFGYVFGSD